MTTSTGPASSTPTASFRPARAQDAEALSAFAARTFHATYAPHDSPEDLAAYAAASFTVEVQAAEIADPALSTLLVEVQGELAGYAQLRAGPAPAGVPGERPLEVARFYVDARWQGTGLAVRLMDEVAARAAAEGHDALWLGVFRENARAIAFYLRRGFRVVGAQPFVLGSKVEEDDVMALPIPPAETAS